jgi:uncharacterized membrane protein
MPELVVNTYNSLKFVHVLSAVVWVGGACTLQAFAIRISATGDGVRMATFAKDAEYVGNRIFLPSSIILLVSGIFTIHESSGVWSYSQTWVQVGLVMIVVSIAIGAGFIGPEAGRVAHAIEQHGPESDEARSRISRIFLVSRFELVLLLLVIFDMVVKPGT